MFGDFCTFTSNFALTKILEGTLHVIDTFTKRKSVTKQRDKACKQDINRILLLDSDSLGFESFRFGILNCPSLIMTVFRTATLRTFFFAIFAGAKELIYDNFSVLKNFVYYKKLVFSHVT